MILLQLHMNGVYFDILNSQWYLYICFKTLFETCRLLWHEDIFLCGKYVFSL